MKLDDSIKQIKGIGEKREKELNGLDIYSVEDLLYYFPRKYENRQLFPSFSSLKEGEKGALALKILGIIPSRGKGAWQRVSFEAEDSRGLRGQITFFNQNYLKNRLKSGNTYIFYGALTYYGRLRTFTNPEIIWKKHEKNKIKALYSQKKGFSSEVMTRLIGNIPLDSMEIQDNLPLVLRENYGLMDRKSALMAIHHPQSMDVLENAKKRFIFEEFFYQQLGIFYLHSLDQNKTSPLRFYKKDEILNFFKDLPYSLTTGQELVWSEIENDLISGNVMNRLVQGDVGSGKTIIAIAALYFTVLNNYQGALMAPTEILARQHYESFQELLGNLPVTIALLTGSVKEKEKESILQRVSNGDIDILIGTHALIEDSVMFKNLGLTITDEQHRFGVRQRERLREKGKDIHTLVMTATPIPRTLALTYYGDLDVSIIDTLPPGRQKVETIPIGEGQLPQAFEFIRSQLRAGRQGYFVCPLIEDNETMDLDAVLDIYHELKEKHLQDFTLGLLHGKMKNDEKDHVMDLFYSNKIQALVSTTVIEVGVNVPNANFIFVYNAERFGLAQLHQLRGRVGRGKHKSTCILYNTGVSEISRARLSILQKSQDGFYIAEKDLELRGAGDFFGTRQHGFMELKIGDPIIHREIFHLAQKEARRFHRRFPWKDLGENPLKQKLVKMFASRKG